MYTLTERTKKIRFHTCKNIVITDIPSEMSVLGFFISPKSKVKFDKIFLILILKGGGNISIILYTVKEVAQIIHSNTTYVYELIKKGYLPAMKLGSYKIRASSLAQFLLESEGKDLTDLNDVKELPIDKS